MLIAPTLLIPTNTLSHPNHLPSNPLPHSRRLRIANSKQLHNPQQLILRAQFIVHQNHRVIYQECSAVRKDRRNAISESEEIKFCAGLDCGGA
jgi:hypothetical protein